MDSGEIITRVGMLLEAAGREPDNGRLAAKLRLLEGLLSNLEDVMNPLPQAAA